MTCIVLLSIYDVWFTLITISTVIAYIGMFAHLPTTCGLFLCCHRGAVYTISVTEWRNKFRRLMNEKDNESTNKAVDSLINFETVKYFCNEEHEAKRFEHALDGTYLGGVVHELTYY